MTSPIRLLVVDDEVALTRSLKLNLEDTGRYEVYVVNDSRQAIATALRVQPDVILLDLMMPHMDGGDVSRALQENRTLARTPVILLTALVRKTEETELQLGGRVRMGIGKPVTLSELDAAVNKVLDAVEFH